MTTNLQAVRGTRDILPEESDRFRLIHQTACRLAKLYGFGEIMTPMFEFTDVFQRTLGDTSDIVSKEMYTFNDRGGDSITLRPEGTAGIARSFISEGLAQQIPVRFYYFGPMFRYERPQKGRYRQFHQIGVECIGVQSPLADVECISMSRDILSELGLIDKVQLEINTLGDQASRQQFRSALVEYFSRYENELSAESKERLKKNPLRILDSKDPNDRRLIEGAPHFEESLSTEARHFFDKVLKGLGDLNIPFQRNSRLVRGLDYYCHTVFEWTTSHLGAQSAVLAGGRYDGLIESMGGPSTPGVGWASGVERLALLLDEGALSKLNPPPKWALILAEEIAEGMGLNVAHQLRSRGIEVEIPMSGNLGKKFKRADKMGCEKAIILGSQEVENKMITVKNLKTGEQNSILEDIFWAQWDQ